MATEPHNSKDSLSHLLTDDDKRALLRLARNTLRAAFSGEEDSTLREFESGPLKLSQTLSADLPCFVTLSKRNGRLRGCIGSMVSFNPLYKNVAHMVRQAAFEDPRFRPMVKSELEDTEIHIAVLGPMRPLENLDGLVLGKQGLHVSQRGRTGVLLASVATDNGFSKERFLAETCIKAGLDPHDVDKYQISTFDEVSFGESDFS